MTHHVEDVGKYDLIFIEVLQADRFSVKFQFSLYYLQEDPDRC